MLKNLADMFRSLFGRRTRKSVAADRRRDFLNQFCKGRVESLEGRALMAAVPFSGTTYTQDFQTLGDTNVTAANITVQQMNEISAQSSGGSVSGWYAYQGVSSDVIRWGITDGTANSGGVYGLRDSDPAANLALGSISSSSDTMHWGVVLQNTSGGTINTLALDYDAVISRNPTTTANPYALSWLVSTADVAAGSAQAGAGTFNNAAGTWNTTSLGFTTPASGTGAPGTAAAISPMFKIADVTGNLSGLNWQNNEYLYLRFADADDSGSDAAAGVDNFSVSVPSGNQTPVNTVPGAQAANQGASLTFSAANGNGISIADDSATVTLTLSSTNGNLTLSTLTGLTGSGNGTTTLSYVGTPADINTALSGLTYNSSTLGADTLVVTTNDGTLSDTDNVAITTYNMTPLAAGDLALVHFDTGGTPGDNFSFLVLKTLNAGTRFWISDNEITADGDSTFTDVGEAEALFVVNDGQSIPAGTVIKLRSDTPETTTAYTWAGGGGLGGSSEELYFYTSNNVTGQTPTTFIYGAVVGSASARPAGLTTGTTFISIAATAAARYKTTGELYNASQSLLLASIGDTVNNWESIAAGTTVNTTDWTFTVATGPEANLQGNSIDIASGDTTPSTIDNTDFGSAGVGGANVDRTFTIQNYGATDITLSGSPNPVAITGGSNFSILAQPASTTIAAGSSVTFVVRFTPTTVGAQTATISIANNDSNENPYTFDVTGTVTAVSAPEVDVQGNSVSIADGDTTPDSADHTQFPSTNVGASSTRTFTILNTGSANLTLSNFQSSSGLFVIQNAPAGPIAPSGSATFDVVYSPTAVGSTTATISFDNNDASEGTYNFDVSGTATPAPTVLVAGDIAFTAVHADSTAPAADSFEFVALRDMNVGTTIYFFDSTFDGTAFAANESGMRWVAQSAVTAGTKFSFASAPGGSGVANTPEWTGIIPTTGAVDTDAEFGLSTSGETIHAVINPVFGGSNALTGTVIAAVYFGDMPATLPSGIVIGDNAVSIGNIDNGQYDPSASGSVETGSAAQVRISINTATNWVTSENPLSPQNSTATFTIVNEPEINVQGGGLNIADGDTTPATADGTDFGAAVQGGANVDRTFTIQNLGSQPLVLSGGPNFVTVTGGSNFSILTQPASGTIAAGASATFVVRMTPTTIATQTATVTITSDDADEATYDIAVTSIVTASAASTTTALNTVTPLNAAAGDSITFAGTVVAGSGVDTPIGTVEIRNGGASGTLLASTTTIGGTGVNGTFNIVSTTVPAGTYNSIQAFFVPGAGFQASSSATFSGTLDIVAAATYVTYSTAGATYSQNFDALINTGTVTLSGVGPFHLADPQFATTPVTGWYFSKIGGSGSDALFRVDDGNSFSGSIYSYGAAAASDRALGTLSSGSTVSRFGAVIRNTTGSLLDTFTITFDGEQWRNGVGSSTAANVLDFEYAIGVAPGGTIDGTGFTGDSGLDFTAPVATSTEGALDGNTAGLTTGITKTISGISWAAGTDLIIRWSDLNDTGNDDGLGIDNFTFSAATTAPNGSLSYSSPTYNVTEDGVTATVTVNRVGNTTGAISVDYSTVVGGTAVAGVDYTTSSGTLNWIAGNNDPQTFTIPIADNLTLNANKTINIALSNPQGGATLAGNTTGVVTIRENEQATQVLLNELVVNPPTSNDRPYEFIEVRGTASTTLGSYYVVQLDGGSITPANAGNVWFLAELSNATMGSNGLLVVKAATGGHATTAPTTEVGSGLLDIANGRGLLNTAQTTAIIFSPAGLTLDQDLDTNNDGTLDLPAGAVLVDAVGWKDNSDLNAGLYAGFVYGGAEIYNEPFPLAGSGTPDAASRFFNNSTPLTAVAWFGGDIVDSGDPASVTYDSAKATANLPVGATVSPGIPNTGLSVAAAAGSASKEEGSSGLTSYTFNISRAGDLSTAVDVTWTVTGSGTNAATAADFENGVFPTGLASFAINEATKQITVNVIGDTDIEPIEQFTVTLSNPTNGATIASPTAQATIENDDYQSFVPGDIVLTGINATNPDQFSFVPLVALLPNATINFTDNAYDTNLPGFATNEGVLTYTAPVGGLAAGTKVIIEVNGSTVTVTGGGTATGSLGLSTSGENLFAYSGTSLLPTILFGLTTNTSYITTGTPTSNETYLPPSLTVGTSAVAPFDATISVNAQYTGPTAGTASALRALVADEANWTTSGTALTLSPTNFTLEANSSPVIANQSFSIAENSVNGTVVGTVVASDPNLGQTLTYAITAGNTSGAFAINGSTGQITVANTTALDFETTPSFPLTVSVTDNGSPVASASATVTINLTDVAEINTLHVTSLTPTSTGFVANFSQTFVTSDLNLYGNAALGVTDVTLVGATTGAIRGSLIVNAANNQITFVRTQTGATASSATSVLPNDTYTVTFRSASNGFRNTTSGLLDGNANGTVGDDYSSVFVVNNSAGAVRVSIPDFTRGHGQDVNVPNTGTGLPVYLSTGQNVSSLQFTVNYDPALLSVTGFTPNATLTGAGVAFTVNTSTPGTVVFDITGTTEFSATAGALTLGTLIASVPTTAPYAAKHVLDITNLVVFDNDPGVPQERASIADDAVHVSAYFGDTSGNRQLQSNDGTLLARFNALISTPQIPAVPPAPVPLPSLAIDPILTIGSFSNAVPGSTITVPLTLTVPATESAVGGVTSFNLLVGIDNTKLSFVTNTGFSTLGADTAGFSVTPNQQTTGTTNTLIFNVDGGAFGVTPAINPGETITLGFMTFTILAGATGSANLNLLGSFSSVTTAVFDDSFSELLLLDALGNPAPTNGVDPDNDGVVTIAAGPNQAPTAVNVTPNPASIAENTAVPANLLVGTIGVTDDGQGTNTLSLVGADAAFFTIVGTDLFLNAGTSLDFETKTSYTVTVEVDDTTIGSTPDAVTTFTLNVTNVNEVPTVTGGTFSLPENSVNGTVVGSVTGTDPDAGQTATLAYSITVGNTGGAFAISNSGQITVANSAALDFETTPVFTLIVQVADTGGLSGTNTVTINLTDVFEAPDPIYINEIFLNPPGTDSPNEYIELRGTPNATIPNGTYLVGVEGDTAGAAGAGDVQNIFDLSGKTFGSNGLMVLLQKGATYVPDAAASVYQNTGTGAGWGSGASSNIGHTGDGGTDIENASATFMLVSAPVAPTLADDIDTLDSLGDATTGDGVPDGSVYATWTVLDSVGLLDTSGSGDFSYGLINFAADAGGGVSTTGPVFTFGQVPGYVARVGNSTGYVASDWLTADQETGAAPSFFLSLAGNDLSNAGLAGAALNHIGLTNNFSRLVDIPISSASVPENSAPGTTVGTFTTTDSAGVAPFTYSLVPGTGSTDNAAFTLTTAGVLTINGSANFETQPSYSVRVRSTDAGGTFFEKQVTISVTDVNETPIVTSGGTASFAENASGTAYTITANDPDAATTLVYSIGGTDASLFNVDSVTGAVSFNASPNFEAPADSGNDNVYDITVAVSDGSLSSSQAVAITVTDVNDAPVVTSGATASFAENASGTVYTITATDEDQPAQTPSYSIGGADASLFNIDSVTGAVTFKASPNFEAPADAGGNNVYDITVSANDGTASSVAVPVAITVTNVNENPFFSPNTAAFTIGENAANGTVVGTVTAQDPDAGDTRTYAITAGNGTGGGAFAINSTTGQITVADSAQMTAQVYSLTVTSTDALGLTGTIAVDVTVSANQLPVFGAPNYTFSLSENSVAGSAVGSVSATDPELALVIYSLSGVGSSNFAINPSTGAITVAAGAVLDFEGINTFALTASASDGFLSSSVPVTINLTNVNEAPTITSGGAFSVSENTTAITTVTATDPDTVTTLAYSIVGGADAGKFSIDEDLGLLAFLSAPDFENPTDVGANNVYDLIVRVSDGSLTNDQAVAVTVTNVNEAPTFNAASYTFSVLDSAASNGSNVGTVVATDPDAGATLTYTLSPVGNGTGTGAFAVNSVTGQITVNDDTQIDFFTTPQYNLTALVSDGSFSVSVPVVVNITFVNQNPTFITLSNNSVAENLPAGTPVGSFSTVDSDLPNDSHSYTLLTTGTGSADHASFSIVGNELRTNASFDYEAKSSYTIRVRTTDQGGATFDRVFTVYVTDVVESGNQAPTNIALSGSQTVAPTGTTGTPVGNLSTSDPNPGDTFTYTLSGPDAAKFQVNGAVLRLASDVTDPVGTVYSFSVTSTDQGGLFFTKAFAITVAIAPNVAPTYITLSANAVPENMPANTVVGTFGTTDANPGDTHTYTLMTSGTGSTDHASFNIAGNQLRTSASFDYESKTSYNIRVRTTDQGGLSFERVFTVYVTNVVETGNQAPTNINLSGGLTVAPAAAPGTAVGTLTTTDPNPGNTFTYAVGGADGANFVANGNLLQVAPAALIGPVGNVYNISITSTDQGGLFFTKNFTITVAVAPNVAPSHLILSNNRIAENAGANALVGTFSTTDANSGDTHTYSLVTGTGSTNNALFTIVGNELRANGSFDYEVKRSYNIRVQTTDQDGLSFDRIFTIYVTDVPGA